MRRPAVGKAAPRQGSRRVLAQLVPLAVLTVVAAAVMGVAGLRARAERSREASLLLVRLESLTHEQYAQLGSAVAEPEATPMILDDVRASRAAFDQTLARLYRIDGARQLSGVRAHILEFRESADAAYRMLLSGQPSLATDRLRGQTAEAARRLQAQLEDAAALSSADADFVDQNAERGSLAVLLVAGGVVWLLLRRASAARSDAERGHAELANQQRFRSLVQNSSDVITVVDRNGIIRYQTPSVTQVFGYDPQALVGTDLADLVHPDDLRSVQRTLTATSRGSGSERVECRVRHADGTWRYAETAVSARLDDPMVAGLIMNTRDITERQTLEEQLAHQAFHDSLTGLANRALFRDRVELALARMRRHRTTAAVLLVDLDSFKTVNDSLGHAFGDAFLVEVAARLRDVLRPTDTPCRLGGDEFAVLVEDLERPLDATFVAERVLQALRMPFMVEGKEIITGGSVGIAIAETSSRDADDLLRNADVAMYTAKARGRNRYELFKPSMHQVMLDRLDLEADLRRAVERGEFVLQYQPTVTLADGSIAGMEALVRWVSPERGTVPPGVFIPVAEDTGLVVPLGAWVLEEACRQSVAWKRTFGSDAPETISVNLSARQLQHESLVADVSAILARTGIRPEHVVLEITESAVMADAETMTARLHELKALGVRLAIDDFGTGYSSMSYLCSFPIDILKIDRSFVNGVRTEPQKAGIVRTIVELGRILDLQTIAEGIELDEELQQLRALDCDLGQGFWFAHPLDAGEAERLFRRQANDRGQGRRILVAAPLDAS